MNVAAVQFKPIKGDFHASLARLLPLVTDAAEGADLVVLPEMALTGYVFASPDAVLPVCEAPDGPTFAALSAVARQAGAWIVAGFPERDGTRLFNSALVIDRAGDRRFVYRKTCLYEADVPWATPGDSGYRTFDTGNGVFGVGICMDINDIRFTRWCETTPMRAIAFPTNWIDQGQDIWSYWAGCIARTDAALVAADTYGSEDGTAFWGRSAILDAPRRPGTDPAILFASAGATGDAVIRATLPPRPAPEPGRFRRLFRQGNAGRSRVSR